MLLDDYAREIRTMGECYLLIRDDHYRILATSEILVGPAGVLYDGEPLPDSATVYHFIRPHPKYPRLPEAKPNATPAAIEKWFVADLLKAEGA